MTRYICVSCDAANYADSQQGARCWNCGSSLTQRRETESFSANEILEDVKHIAKEAMHEMNFNGMSKCEIMSEIIEAIDYEYC